MYTLAGQLNVLIPAHEHTITNERLGPIPAREHLDLITGARL